MSGSTECVEQSVELGRHLPSGREIFDVPKPVRSYITTRSLGSSCMCMAEMPMLCRRTDQDPPAAGHAWAWRKRIKRKRR
ncbi:hypothetical protein Hanom_Chr09g00769271 [Helianthus anomalus]